MTQNKKSIYYGNAFIKDIKELSNFIKLEDEQYNSFLKNPERWDRVIKKRWKEKDHKIVDWINNQIQEYKTEHENHISLILSILAIETETNLNISIYYDIIINITEKFNSKNKKFLSYKKEFESIFLHALNNVSYNDTFIKNNSLDYQQIIIEFSNPYIIKELNKILKTHLDIEIDIHNLDKTIDQNKEKFKNNLEDIQYEHINVESYSKKLALKIQMAISILKEIRSYITPDLQKKAFKAVLYDPYAKDSDYRKESLATFLKEIQG